MNSSISPTLEVDTLCNLDGDLTATIKIALFPTKGWGEARKEPLDVRVHLSPQKPWQSSCKTARLCLSLARCLLHGLEALNGVPVFVCLDHNRLHNIVKDNDSDDEGEDAV